jgi:hypothetical protein
MALCMGEDGLRHQLALYQIYYNVCLPHASLSQPLPEPDPTHGIGRPRWPLAWRITSGRCEKCYCSA